jgi:signal transduction histidine kinase
MSTVQHPAPLSKRQSLRWRLPFLVCGLVAVILITFLWAAYLRVEATLVRAAGERAQVAADRVASILDGQRSTEQIRQLGADPALRKFLRSPTSETRDQARARLSALAGSSLRRVELWNAAGSRLLEISNPGSVGPGGASRMLPGGSFPLASASRELQRSDDIAFSDTVAEIREGTDLLGFLLIRSTFVENPPGIFSRLVGRDAVVRIANRTGDVWANFSGAVPPVPVALARPGVARYRADNGEMRIGAVSHVRATPWAVWVDFPLTTAVAPARLFLSQMVPVTFIFLAAAAVMVGIVSARITQPLSELNRASEAIAAGDYSRRVLGKRRDEIGRLGRTFNAMAGQIQEAHQRLEARVAERTARLEAANKELEAFSYSVSHDLRAPLRSIDGFSQALLEDSGGKLNAKEQGYLQRVRAAAQRMGELIDDLLALSHVGRVELGRHHVSVSEMGHAVANELRKRDPERQVEVDIQDGLVADADDRLVKIVLENLLGNAWKFTKHVTQAKVQLGAEAAADGQAVYFVRDNGAGFDMTYMNKLFRPFQRLHSDADFPGTGIGLATVHRIVDRHGGRVWAEGAVGQGATVYFTLPNGTVEART